MITIGSFAEKLKKSMEKLKLVSDEWKNSPFGRKYEVEDISFSKKCLFVYTGSSIVKKDIEINSDEIVKLLNKKLPGRKFIKEIKVKVGKR
ncbi:MAG: hypothetical protein J7L54_04350 [Elusimicrobia bacterium]|nr:hypothetical protein [Elusimicrobiota bacterium]